MSGQLYNWKRFWCPREGRMSLDDGGYLFDLDSELGRFYNNSCVPFESIEDTVCLALLGEPGIGKSTAMNLQKTLINYRIAETGGASLWINLNAYQTDLKLCQEIFENSTFQTWQKGEHKLHLFLDSLDECRLYIKNVANILVKEFKNYPVKRLFLRIACRTADWPNSLEKGLKDLWGENSVGVYELTPLRRIDVIEAAKANGLNPEEFLPEIERMKVVPFAIKPVTLQFLINIYKRSGQFPQGQAELYYQGCKILCEEIVGAAKKYVLEQDPNTSEWLGTDDLHRPAFAGYRALLLLVQEAPVFLNTIPADIWKKWAPIIIACPISSGSQEEESHQKVVDMAYRYAPEEIIKILMVMIDQENKEHDHIFITRKILGCWDKHIADALLAKAREPELKPKCLGSLLGDLLEHEHEEAKEFAQSLITFPLPKTENARQRAVVAAAMLLCHAKGAGWPVVWLAMQQDLEFGKEVVFEVAQVDRHSASIGQKLSEEQLADLFIWLARQFPYSEDPVYDETHWVGPRERVAEWKNSILNQLKNRCTQEACNAIQGIVRELPELAWLKWTLLDARIIARRHTWLPYRPEEILKMVTNRQLRLVNSGEQLLDVLVESLKRYEAKLQGETPSVIDLWNENPYRPKDEGRFSDHIKRHLEEDLRQRGIIVNREVRIRRGVGAGTGEQTDIHVDAITQSQGETYDSVTVIIEVKGCWNDELRQAMRTQLVDRYLKDNRCQNGLYLIGWFNCEQWDDEDNRKKKASKISLNEAKADFDVQAQEISQGNIKVRALVLNAALR